MKCLTSLLMMGLLGWCMASSAEGATTYSHRTAFDAAAGTTSSEGFEAYAHDIQTISRTLDYGDFQASYVGSSQFGNHTGFQSGNAYPTEGNRFMFTIFTNSSSSLTLTFDNPIVALAFDLTDVEIQPLQFALSNGSTGIAAVAGNNGNQQFIGITDFAQPFDSITFKTNQPGDGVGYDRMAYAFAPAAQPIPAPLAIMPGLGLLLVMYTRLRNNRMMTVMLGMGLLLSIGQVYAGQVVGSDPIEPNGAWHGPSQFAYGSHNWYRYDQAGMDQLNIGPTAGNYFFHVNNFSNYYAGTMFTVFDGLTYQAGVYVASIDVSDWPNEPFTQGMTVGMTVGGVKGSVMGSWISSDASHTPTPAPDTMQVWQWTCHLTDSDPQVGQSVGFAIAVPNTGNHANAAFDNLVIEFIPQSQPIPAPLAIIPGAIALAWISRGRKFAV